MTDQPPFSGPGTYYYKLYTPPGSFRAFAPLIAAEYNKIPIEVITENIEGIVKSKSPTGKAPILECLPSGDVIFTSYAISRYIAGLDNHNQNSTTAHADGGGRNLLGRTVQERATINQWIDWTAQDVELPACVLYYSTVGYIPQNIEA
jgi:glutathione S-transferase